jgi:hypothetical protein
MKIKLVILFITTILLSGCIPSHYEKSIEVTKDASGKVVSTKTIERVVQPNQHGYPIKFELINGVQQ